MRIMNVRFMGGTPYARSEIEMQQIPGFKSRKSGMVVSRFSYTTMDCDCRSCIQKAEQKKGCEVTESICQCERLEAGCVPLNELLEAMAAEVGTAPFSARVSRLSAGDTQFFDCGQHSLRFWNLWETHKTAPDEAAWCAAVFLLSADTFLWGKSAMAVGSDFIDFSSIQIHGVDLNGYVLFHVARDLYKGTKHISLSELTDPELVSDWAFWLVVKAFLIRRYGEAVILKTVAGRIRNA